jgi:hypothetical protein
VTRLALVLALAASCSYDTKFGDCQVTCGEQSSCPDGFACGAGNLCRAAGATTSCGAVLDASPGDDAGSLDGSGSGSSGGAIPGIYITDFGDNAIAVYGTTATGSVAPLRTITGSATQLDAPIGIAIDPDGNIVVANDGHGDVLVFARDADGNAAPIRVLADPDLADPFSVAIAADGGVFVAAPGPKVFHFPPGATASDRSFSAPGSTGALYLAIDAAGEVILSSPSAVQTFLPGSTGAAAPLHTFTPATETISEALAISPVLFAVTEATGQIDVFPPTASGTGVAPASRLALPSHAAGQEALAIDTSGATPTFYTSESQSPHVLIVPTHGSGDVLALGTTASIDGSAGFEPAGIAVVPP